MTDLTRPAPVLRADGFAVALAAVLLYRELGAAWWVFAVAFLAPDLAFLAYLAGGRAGAAAYNLAHTYLWPVVLFGVGLVGERSALMAAGLIWLAHIGVDRALGFGLKYPERFRTTHLQKV
ncbi:MAG: hypothetical protein AMS20_08320 [Gemmatimonas sp. SG8_28]|jgi:hypothetical protein|nr:MAG: hypothetical protein AMS20_08320 [Gemmatimonas sp. SG8_28]